MFFSSGISVVRCRFHGKEVIHWDVEDGGYRPNDIQINMLDRLIAKQHPVQSRRIHGHIKAILDPALKLGDRHPLEFEHVAQPGIYYDAHVPVPTLALLAAPLF